MYYTVKEFAERYGITEHTLRYYTDIGLLPCKRDGGNRRVFDEESENLDEKVSNACAGRDFHVRNMETS